MKRNMIPFISRGLSWLIVWALLLGLVAMPAVAEADPTVSDPNDYAPLKPTDLVYQLDGTTATSDANTAITLHKQAVRTGPTKWTVDVSATIKSEKVEQREIDVVFVLDASGSMAWCADEVAHTSSGHQHKQQCYGNINLCGLEKHEHLWNNNCYSKDKCTYETHPDHYTDSGQNRRHRTDLTCLKQQDGSYYALTCTQTAHSHSKTCKLKCGQAAASHSNTGAEPCSYTDVTGTHNYPTRLEVAKDAISTLADSLPSYVEPKYVAFSSKGYINNTYDAIVMESYDALEAKGATKMMAGVNLGIDQFSNNENTKILVVVTDGASEDGYTSNKYENFTKKGGVVFTVGFNHDNANLKGMIANGGAYYQATNPGELIDALEDIDAKLSAMIEDPMGNVVGFDKDGFQDNVHTNIGEVTYVGDTIYWNPTANDTSISEITYSYEVTLDAENGTNASFHTVGTHSQVPLNNTTYFHYSVDSNSRDVVFPIPKATYAISTLQTTWKTTDNVTLAATNNTETVIAPTTAGAPEKIVGCDFKNGDGSWYFTDFTQAYSNTNLLEIGVANPTKYLYVGTEVYLNGVKQDGGLKLIDPTQPNAYEVVHIYREVKPGSLIVSKEVTGNMGSRNRDFSFTLTLPAMVNKMISVSRDGGNTYTKLSLNHSGQYTFTLKHGEFIAFGDLEGSCTVQEADAAPYSTQYSVNGTPYQSGLSHTIPRVEDTAYTLAFRNTLEATIPTGVFTSSAAAMAGLLLSALMFTITRAGRRARNDE